MSIIIYKRFDNWRAGDLRVEETAVAVVSGVDETRTRGLMRDRHAF